MPGTTSPPQRAPRKYRRYYLFLTPSPSQRMTPPIRITKSKSFTLPKRAIIKRTFAEADYVRKFGSHPTPAPVNEDSVCSLPTSFFLRFLNGSLLLYSSRQITHSSYQSINLLGPLSTGIPPFSCFSDSGRVDLNYMATCSINHSAASAFPTTSTSPFISLAGLSFSHTRFTDYEGLDTDSYFITNSDHRNHRSPSRSPSISTVVSPMGSLRSSHTRFKDCLDDLHSLDRWEEEESIYFSRSDSTAPSPPYLPPHIRFLIFDQIHRAILDFQRRRAILDFRMRRAILGSKTSRFTFSVD